MPLAFFGQQTHSAPARGEPTGNPDEVLLQCCAVGAEDQRDVVRAGPQPAMDVRGGEFGQFGGAQ